MIKRSLLALLLLSSIAGAKNFEVRVVKNTFDEVPEPFDDPALEAASLTWLGYLDRVIYSPTPIILTLSDIAFTDGTLGTGAALYGPPHSNDPIEEALGLNPDYAYCNSLLVALGARSYPGRGGDQSINISAVTDWDLTTDPTQPTQLYSVLTHELVHGLGFGSRLSIYSESFDERNGSWGLNHGQPGIFDKFIVSSGKAVIDMTSNAERAEVFYNEGNVVFSGPITNLYAAEILTAGGGAEGVQLQASATFENIRLSHFATAVEPDALMEPYGLEEDVFVSFAVLADLGYGDMLDTQVALHSSGTSSLVLAVKSETLQERATVSNIVLTLPAIAGITAAPTSNDMTCDSTSEALVCTLDSFNTNEVQLAGFDFSGAEGAYTMVVDIEHRAMHVDANPLNNFLDVAFEVGTNPLTGISLSASQIDEGLVSGEVIGDLAVIATADTGDIAYSLVKGAGSSDNHRVTLSNGQVITAINLDHEAKEQLSIRVKALLANGFSHEQALTIQINDTDADGCLNNQVVSTDNLPLLPWVNSAYASGGNLSLSGMPVLLWLVHIIALAAVRSSSHIRGRWKLLLIAGLTLSLVACSGGGNKVTSC